MQGMGGAVAAGKDTAEVAALLDFYSLKLLDSGFLSKESTKSLFSDVCLCFPMFPCTSVPSLEALIRAL